MKLIILRTDIKTKKKVKKMASIFNQHNEIISWSVDTEDIDNVLRIESTDQLFDEDIIQLVSKEGFYAEDLPEYLFV